MTSFSDPKSVDAYAKMAERNVPALHDLHRMVGVLLAEKVPADGRVLVLGAGGGLELRAMASMHTGWRFDGIDPSTRMLDQARVTTRDFTDRIMLHEGYIDDAPQGPFDGATCLLTLHFLAQEERVHTLKELYRRLEPGAPLVTVHHSFPNDDASKDKWLARFAAYVAAFEIDGVQSSLNIQAMKERLPILSPEQDIAALHAAGFSQVELFYAALTFKGWVAYKG
ncbi:class I SAM-dependent methyltransferase [Pusillimonas noertemannii]|uniref:tRNA (Cmo5U34)-methyltransferase n=1 Tax=Pusillimonas noertemannii TaxID=305977 RepID=A0A2U1CMN5_9BURK|nr:class I SAM-dependent methyltransferase [Pusillimonas noertemannii]NYT68717.1 class I SAM-dependent methyltransferase [Pusillimonas noertemannii]PVY62264.1 tRNA (cmo5U34)-methyltransferase [Pusillimonas noertemannii]TFL10759.1 class I SAM-dependent methyltransferase [Pusillimonas noertemannii]